MEIQVSRQFQRLHYRLHPMTLEAIDCTSFISDIVNEDKDLHISFYSELTEQVICDAIQKVVKTENDEFHVSGTKNNIGIFTVHFEKTETARAFRTAFHDLCLGILVENISKSTFIISGISSDIIINDISEAIISTYDIKPFDVRINSNKRIAFVRIPSDDIAETIIQLGYISIRNRRYDTTGTIYNDFVAILKPFPVFKLSKYAATKFFSKAGVNGIRKVLLPRNAAGNFRCFIYVYFNTEADRKAAVVKTFRLPDMINRNGKEVIASFAVPERKDTSITIANPIATSGKAPIADLLNTPRTPVTKRPATNAPHHSAKTYRGEA